MLQEGLFMFCQMLHLNFKTGYLIRSPFLGHTVGEVIVELLIALCIDVARVNCPLVVYFNLRLSQNSAKSSDQY